jgi:1-pyrroline-5-carboxylate dehydrogenase
MISHDGGATRPVNEPVETYAVGSTAIETLQRELAVLSKEPADAKMRIGDSDVVSRDILKLTAPHDHSLVVAYVHQAGEWDIRNATAAAMAAAPEWAALPLSQRSAVFRRAADLLSGPWRARLNAATMLGQSKSVHQAEIDAACELADFWRFNAYYAERIESEQPFSPPGSTNRLDYRPLDGFVLAISPFNFTAIGGNLPSAPALMGNTVVWKPAVGQALSAHYTMLLLREAGLPPGVINLVHGDGALAAEVAIAHPKFAGLHFTGSSAVFSSLWRLIGNNLSAQSTYPRLVGETGGKNFVLAHASADVEALAVGLARGAFEYQGQKCSAASRAYIPRSLWPRVRAALGDIAAAMPMGDVADPRIFLGAVINRAAFDRLTGAIAAARARGDEIVSGGTTRDSAGWFVEPTVIRTEDPHSDGMTRELFGPILTVFVYDDADWERTLELVGTSTPYALTGAVFATEPKIVAAATTQLRSAAGNFYINDKPTGAVVGQQPFGGSRASGTNDKAGSMLNLLRWTSPRTIKEQHVPIREWRYPHQISFKSE